MKKKTILLVDDEVDYAETLAIQLRLHGYEIELAHTGLEALEKVKEKPELILLDVMMPIMGGYEVCSRLRQDDETKNIPIIMLTAKRTTQDKVEGLMRGADDFVSKTVDLEELCARIEALLRRRGVFTELEQEKAALADELKDIIHKKTINALYQPIIDLQSKKTIGYEVFAHGPAGSQLENPEVLFGFALECGMIFELEIMVRKKILSALSGRVGDAFLFFNNHPYIMQSERFEEILALYDNPGKIVFEVTERAEIEDFDAFCRVIKSYKEKGFRFSVDDVGSGFSSLEAVAELEPDYAKLGKHLVIGIGTNKKKENLVKTILSMCKQNSIYVIAEGIEVEEDLQALIRLGVEGGQGYLLGRPASIEGT